MINWKKIKGCPNFSKTSQRDPRIRRGPYSIKCIVIHYTAGSLRSTINTFLNPNDKVSAHLVIDREGIVHEVLEPHYIAWHAGHSSWRGIESANSFSYGIELVAQNEVEDPDRRFTFTDAQYRTLNTVLWGGLRARPDGSAEDFPGLVKQFKLDPDEVGKPDAEVLGHEHIAPKRKHDPGPLFEWDRINPKKSIHSAPKSPSKVSIEMAPEVTVKTNKPPTRSNENWLTKLRNIFRELG